TSLGIAATFINSSLAPAEAYQRIEQMARGQFDLVYIAPERLRSSLFIEKLRETKVQLLAVDEAHCVSEWGHDFRPDYARLGEMIDGLRTAKSRMPILALTATDKTNVRQDIAAALGMRDQRVMVAGLVRPNNMYATDGCPVA